MLAFQDIAGRWSTAQIHDTVAAIARQRAFNARQSLLGRLFQRVLEWIADLFRHVSGSPSARIVVFLGIAALLTVVVARLIVRERVESTAGRVRGSRTRSSKADPWADATAFAAAGDYTAACHAIYAGVVDVLARDGALIQHLSKTSGDYRRELRARAVRTAADFSAFALDFDRVIYGVGVATEEDYQRLRRSAETAVQQAGELRVAA